MPTERMRCSLCSTSQQYLVTNLPGLFPPISLSARRVVPCPVCGWGPRLASGGVSDA